jgi:hypothetical protein
MGSDQDRSAKPERYVLGSVASSTHGFDAVLLATSMMFVSRPATEDHMPASADGNIADIHVTQFQNAIDSLLQAARYALFQVPRRESTNHVCVLGQVSLPVSCLR